MKIVTIVWLVATAAWLVTVIGNIVVSGWGIIGFRDIWPMALCAVAMVFGVKTHIQLRLKGKDKCDTEDDVAVEPDIEPEVDAGFESSAVPEVDVGASESSAVPEVDAGSESSANAESGIDSETNAESESDIESEPDSSLK